MVLVLVLVLKLVGCGSEHQVGRLYRRWWRRWRCVMRTMVRWR